LLLLLLLQLLDGCLCFRQPLLLLQCLHFLLPVLLLLLLLLLGRP
jgi:hypothetical protein